MMALNINDCDDESRIANRDRTREQYLAADPIQCSVLRDGHEKHPITAPESSVPCFDIDFLLDRKIIM